MLQGKVVSNIFSKWANGKKRQKILSYDYVGQEGDNGLVGVHSSKLKFNPLNLSLAMQLLGCKIFVYFGEGHPWLPKLISQETFFKLNISIILSKAIFWITFKRTHSHQNEHILSLVPYFPSLNFRIEPVACMNLKNKCLQSKPRPYNVCIFPREGSLLWRTLIMRR